MTDRPTSRDASHLKMTYGALHLLSKRLKVWPCWGCSNFFFDENTLNEVSWSGRGGGQGGQGGAAARPQEKEQEDVQARPVRS